ncbi:MAG: hypothetical protein ACXAD7_25250 [Candidatus Kariarchaeaceae archaeon]|jgi:hypothetical protein
MVKKKILTALIGFSMLLLLLAPSAPVNPSLMTMLPSKVSGNRVDFAQFTVIGGASGLTAGTPIVLKTTDFQLPYSMLQTAVVMDSTGSTAYTTQCDDLNGDNIVDEIVFLLPNPIAASAQVEFLLRGSTDGASNGDAADAALKVSYETNYSDTYDEWLPAANSQDFMNGTAFYPMVSEVGEVVWAETEWGIVCLYVSAGWRQSSWKHIITKGTNDVDLVMGEYNASNDWRWQWTKFGYEADQGWHNGDAADTVTMAEAGPLRIVIQTESGIGYNGLFGVDSGLKARRTFVLYKSIPGIIRNLQIIGENGTAAFESMTDFYGGPMTIASKFVAHDQNTTSPVVNKTLPWTGNKGAIDYNFVYSPNDPGLADNDSRWQISIIYPK